jgi:hypothetical protein
MEPHVRKDEVDILETAVKLVRFLMKNLLWVILFPLAGLLGGYLLKYNKPPQYQSQLLLRGVMMAQEEMTMLLYSYTVTGIPGISPDEALRLQDFSFKVYLKENSLFANITFIATDTTILKKVQKILPDQLNQEDLVRSYFEVAKNYNSKLALEYREKIQIAEALIQEKKQNDAALIGMPELMNLYTRLGEVEINLNQKGLIRVVSRYKPMPLGNGRIKGALKGLIGGVLLLSIFLVVKSFIIYYRKSNIAAS